MTTTIPEDVKAYMAQAATQIAKEKGFVPENETQMTEWLMVNRVEICERASKLMWSLLEKMRRPEVKKAVTGVMAAKVWGTIRTREINRQVNSAVEAVLA